MPSGRETLSVVIPTWNEEENIRASVEAWLSG
jgi:glycosyltransferase involved in cell wall biosynthesis